MKSKKVLDLALQGGGSHGAFTWGVIDRFLEEDSLDLGGLCGTSAGAMNATVLAYGLHKGGKTLARELLHKFWNRVSEMGAFSMMQPSWIDKAIGPGNMDYSPGFLFFEMMTEFLSPYQFNPMDVNPLRGLMGEIVNFEELRACNKTKLFVCATNVKKCRAKVFDLKQISLDAVMASACLPFLFKAVTIDGEDYWDGGYMGNPPIFPLIDGTDCSDIMIIQVNPINIKETPKTVVEIRDRINEITFNSSLMLEMRRVNFVEKLLDSGFDYDGKMRHLRFHAINPEEHIAELNISSKLNAQADFIGYLYDLGRTYASDWLNVNYESIGVNSTVSIEDVYLR